MTLTLKEFVDLTLKSIDEDFRNHGQRNIKSVWCGRALPSY